MKDHFGFISVLLLCLSSVVLGITDPGDFAVLDEFRRGLKNAHLLKWPSEGSDPCGPPKWENVFCTGSRVSQIQVQGFGLAGPLPGSFNKLTELYNIGLQRNNFTGKLPSFNGLKNLQYAFLGNNQFDTIPSDFFVGLDSLRVLSLDNNPLNQSDGWALPRDLEGSSLLTNLSFMGCNLVGSVPDFLGGMASLQALKLSYNKLTGGIPASFEGSNLQILWLNGQSGTGLTGSVDVLASMVSLTSVWLHANAFTGPIPEGITACTSLQDLQLYRNQLVGLIPSNMTNLPRLQTLKLDNNKLMGSIPKLSIQNFTYAGNSFCQADPGVPCSPEVDALLDFLREVSYPSDLTSSWSGNDPCAASWLGITCVNNKVTSINLPNHKLNGTISPSVGTLNSVQQIRLQGNNISGTLPTDLAKLESLTMLNLTSNNLQPPLPNFKGTVKVLIDQNPLFNVSPEPPSPGDSPPSSSVPSPPGIPSTKPGGSSSPSGNGQINSSNAPKMSKLLIIVIPVTVGVIIISFVFLLAYCRHKTKGASVSSSSIIVHPRDPSDPEDMVKIVVASNANQSISAFDILSGKGSEAGKSHVIEDGNLLISVQVLRSVTANFASENELGRGGFGVVYKGELHDGTMIAVKRMEASVVSNKALDEFQSEIAVLSKVRHRNLVSLLGYSIEGNERLLVYEYMPQGALSKHLFHWKYLNIEPLTWKKRLNIALGVARGMEYLHNLAQQSFIHRDLKSSNILLGNDYRAKVSDFGLVRLAPDGKDSVVTRLAGTFGYLAPEYAVTGKVTTKADVFSFGVVLMELVTGLPALDDSRPEGCQHLASWFNDIKSSKEKLRDALDPALDVTEETFESICIIAELAGHCAAREPQQRPDMGHAVSVLVPLVEKWKPTKEDQEEYLGIDLHQPLLQMVKGWQATDGSSTSSVCLDDSKGSIPARPYGLAESFTSADGR